MNGQERIDERRRRQAGRRGFTLIELLVVMLIILLVSAVVLPTVLPAISHRQVSEAARILQGALAGARDTAINNNAPAGIRLLPDPVLNGQSLNAPGGTAGVSTLDPTRILASNRYIPIQLAPDYSEGLVNVDTSLAYLVAAFNAAGVADPGHISPILLRKAEASIPREAYVMLYVEQSVYNPTTNLLNSPTSWYWNIRIGDKIQLNNTGIWYTIVGPMNIYNPELFVNVGDPGTTPPLLRTLRTARITTRSSSFWSTAWTTTRTATWTTAGTASTTMEMGSLIKSCPMSIHLGEWVEIETWQGCDPQREQPEHPLHHHPPAGGVAGLPRDAAAIECGGRPDDVERPVLQRNFLEHDGCQLRLGAVPAAGRSDHGVRGHPAQSQRHGRADHGVLEPVVVRHEFRLLPLLAGRAGRPVRPANLAILPAAGVPGPAAPGARNVDTPRSGRHPLPQGRAPADHALHPDRAAHHQPGRDVRRDSNPSPCPFLAPQQGIRGDTR